MRIMRNKVVDSADIWEAADSILYIHDAISHRVDDLTRTSAPSYDLRAR